MAKLDNLIANNRNWVKSVIENDANFFNRLADEQKPDYMWIGCSDSRISATAATGLLPGDIFVHRNIANLVIHSDMNCLSVIQFAIEVLQIKHIIVCGHYNCGGVKSALENAELGLIDNWLRHIQDIARLYENSLDQIPDFQTGSYRSRLDLRFARRADPRFGRARRKRRTDASVKTKVLECRS
jgi:carbonic anhydrase